MIIYKATNKINGKSYIGQTIHSVDNRRKRHYYEAKTSNYKFHNALNKYKDSDFEWDIVCECSSYDELNDREQYYINHYNTLDDKNGYNMKPGGLNAGHSEETRKKLSKMFSGEGGPFYGKKHTDESKQKMSEMAKERLSVPENNPMYGKHHSEETRKRWSEVRKGRFTGEKNSFYGKKHSEESLEKMRISTLKQFENGMPEETKKKISDSTKGIPKSEETRKKMSEARKRYWKNKKLQEAK